jgi:enoyl-CoA hydratase
VTVFELERHGEHVMLITINRPEKRNALTSEMFFDLERVLDELDLDDSVRAVVVTGAGTSFCAGHDLNDVESGLSRMPLNSGFRQSELEMRCITRVHDLGKPVIAAVNGPARGGGFSLAAMASMRVVGHDANFSVQFINLDVCSGDCGLSWALPRIVGYGAANDLMLTGRVVSAEESKELGLANRLVPTDDVVDVSLALAQEMAAHDPLALRLTKETIAHSAATSLADALALEARYMMLSLHNEQATARRAETLNRISGSTP